MHRLKCKFRFIGWFYYVLVIWPVHVTNSRVSPRFEKHAWRRMSRLGWQFVRFVSWHVQTILSICLNYYRSKHITRIRLIVKICQHIYIFPNYYFSFFPNFTCEKNGLLFLLKLIGISSKGIWPLASPRFDVNWKFSLC